MIEYGLNIIILSALIGGFIAGYKMNKQLKQLYKMYKPVEDLNTQLVYSLEKAEKSLENVKNISDTTNHSLQEKINQSLVLKEELAFLVSRADQLANQLVDCITVTQNHEEKRSIPLPSLKHNLRNIR